MGVLCTPTSSSLQSQVPGLGPMLGFVLTPSDRNRYGNVLMEPSEEPSPPEGELHSRSPQLATAEARLEL
jgi:hypothetical protein